MFFKKESRAFFLTVDVTCAGWDSFKHFLHGTFLPIVYARPSIIYFFIQSLFTYSFTLVFMNNLNFNLFFQRKHSMIYPWTAQIVIQLDATVHVNRRYSGKSLVTFFLQISVRNKRTSEPQGFLTHLSQWPLFYLTGPQQGPYCPQRTLANVEIFLVVTLGEGGPSSDI